MSTLRLFAVGLVAISILTLSLGCTTDKGNPKKDPVASKDKKGDEHDHENGPHGGILEHWAEGKYHVELTVDHGKKEATVYLLGADEKTPTPLKLKDEEVILAIKEPGAKDPTIVKLKASPDKGDSDGKVSRYVGTHDSLAKEQAFLVVISGHDGTTNQRSDEFKYDPKSTKKK